MAENAETVLTRLNEAHPLIEVQFDCPWFRTEKYVARETAPHRLTRHWIDSTLRRRDDEPLKIHAPAAVILGHVELITLLDGAAKAELQRNSLADVKFARIARERDLEDDFGIDRRRRLSVNVRTGRAHEQE